MSECETAARDLGLSDTTVIKDEHSSGVGYDPPYCYYEGGSLKYNPGVNTGGCSSGDKCICKV